MNISKEAVEAAANCAAIARRGVTARTNDTDREAARAAPPQAPRHTTGALVMPSAPLCERQG